MFGLGLGNVKNYGIKSIGTAAGKGVLEGVTGRKNPTWGSVLGIDTSRILQNPAKVVNEVVRDVISGKKSIADIPSMMFGSFDTVQHRLNSLSNPDNWVDLLTGKNTKLTTSNPYVASARPTTDPGVQRLRNKPAVTRSDVEEFRQIVSQSRGYARPTHFEMEIMPPSQIISQFLPHMKRINWNCSTTDLPPTTLGFFEKRTGMQLTSIASTTNQMGEINANFMVSMDMIERNVMESWQLFIADRYSNTLNYKKNYETVGKITVMSPDSKLHGPVCVVYLTGLYPKAVSPIVLNYNAGNQIMEMQVTFGFDEHIYTFPQFTGQFDSDAGDLTSIISSDPWFQQNIGKNLPRVDRIEDLELDFGDFF